MKEKTDENNNNENSDFIDFSSLFQSNYSSNSKQTEEDYKLLINSPQNLCKILRSDLKKGITTNNKQDMEWRINTFGTNKLPPEKPLRIIDFILECFEDPTLKVLLVSAVISLIIGLLKEGLKTGWIEGSAIFGAVFIVTAISSSLNYNEQLQFQKLKKKKKKKKQIVEKKMKNWLEYWIIFFLFYNLETFFGSFLENIPMYLFYKVVFLAVLFLPWYKGAHYIYHSLLREFFKTYEGILYNFSLELIDKIKELIFIEKPKEKKILTSDEEEPCDSLPDDSENDESN